MDKNQKTQYASTAHVARRDAEGRFYCRALHSVQKGAYCYCQSCPLFGGFGQFGSMEEEPECLYFDFNLPENDYRKPEEEKQRIDGMIMAGMTKEFPDFLDSDKKTENYKIIECAIQFAAEVHKGTMRKETDVPYIAHAMEAMMIVARMTTDNEVIAAAALHDVVEDTETTIEQVRELFSERVAVFVAHESEDKREGLPKEQTWKIRKEEQLEKIKDAPKEAKIIMLGDKLSNMRASLRDFKKSGDAIWNKFNMKDKKEQEWYYRSVAEAIKELEDTPAYLEYVSILDIIFPPSNAQ